MTKPIFWKVKKCSCSDELLISAVLKVLNAPWTSFESFEHILKVLKWEWGWESSWSSDSSSYLCWRPGQRSGSDCFKQIRTNQTKRKCTKCETFSHFYCERSARRTVQLHNRSQNSRSRALVNFPTEKWKTQNNWMPTTVQKIFHFKLSMQLELTLSLQSFENWTECDRDKRSKLCFFVLK